MLSPVRARLLVPLLPCLALLSCKGEPEAGGHDSGHAEVLPGRAPAKAPPSAATETGTPAVEAPAPAPVVDPDPIMAARKQALANVGRSAFDALKAGSFDDLMALTPLVDPYLGEVCPRLPQSPRKELEARFDYCHEHIDWDAVAEAQAFAGKPTGAQAPGCDAGIEDYGRLQLFAHMADASIWKIEFFGAVGEGGNAIGINGEVKCSETDDAPALE